MRRLEVRVASALTKQRPVLLISHEESCTAQETVVAVPIRTVPPPFACKGLLAIASLKDHGNLTGFIRFDLPVFYRRSDIGTRVIHHFVETNDVAMIDAAISEAFGL